VWWGGVGKKIERDKKTRKSSLRPGLAQQKMGGVSPGGATQFGLGMKDSNEKSFFSRKREIESKKKDSLPQEKIGTKQ